MILYSIFFSRRCMDSFLLTKSRDDLLQCANAVPVNNKLCLDIFKVIHALFQIAANDTLIEQILLIHCPILEAYSAFGQCH